jgi:hypothetical protein
MKNLFRLGVIWSRCKGGVSRRGTDGLVGTASQYVVWKVHACVREALNHVLALLVAVLLCGIDRGAGAVRASVHETNGANRNDRKADAGCGGAFALMIKMPSTSEAIAHAALRGLGDVGDTPMTPGGSACSVIRASVDAALAGSVDHIGYSVCA